MDVKDFDFVECQLDVALSNVFKMAFTPFSGAACHKLLNVTRSSPENSVIIDIQTNAELFVIEELRYRSGVDLYAFNPSLVDRRFVEIGCDEGGNSFYMPGDDPSTDELWYRAEDVELNLESQSLTEYFATDWSLVDQEDPFASPKLGTVVTRANHPLRSVFHPITMEEWRRYVENDSDLIYDESPWRHPFTGELTKNCVHPGRVRVASQEEPISISYAYGCLVSSGCCANKLKTIANALTATIY